MDAFLFLQAFSFEGRMERGTTSQRLLQQHHVVQAVVAVQWLEMTSGRTAQEAKTVAKGGDAMMGQRSASRQDGEEGHQDRTDDE